MFILLNLEIFQSLIRYSIFFSPIRDEGGETTIVLELDRTQNSFKSVLLILVKRTSIAQSHRTACLLTYWEGPIAKKSRYMPTLTSYKKRLAKHLCETK